MPTSMITLHILQLEFQIVTAEQLLIFAACLNSYSAVSKHHIVKSLSCGLERRRHRSEHTVLYSTPTFLFLCGLFITMDIVCI